jgi:N6-L-threonylcarbamoyladenine synthase
VGKTRDDAAGEAFDKVAKLLGLGYPGGPVIDRLAKYGDPHAVKFTFAHIKSPARGEAADPETARFDFSFSGIKTAVLRYVETHNMREAVEQRRRALLEIAKPTIEDFLRFTDRATLDLIASFQRAVIDDLVGKTLAAAQAYGVETLFVTGGVAANSELRARFEERAAHEGLAVAFPSRPLSTDNAAMIAAAAYPKFLGGQFASPEFSAEAALVLR